MKEFVFSPEALTVGPSPFRVLADKLAVHPDVINFTIGQPDFDVPEEIKKELCAAAYEQRHGYGATAGVKGLRDKILAAKNFGKDNLDVQITTGVQGGFFTAFRTFVSTGEEVLIPDPYYLEYKGATDLLGLKVKLINTYPLFKLTLEMVKQAVTEKTKVLVMNSPNNPTGVMYDKEEMGKIIRYLDEKGVVVFYDTIYQERYMNTPQANPEGYRKGSPITYVEGLKGNLLLIHGTGDDNVHYQSCEMLVNELVKHGKVFYQLSYPMRSHSISEREGTTYHLRKSMTDYFLKNLPAGGR